MEFVYVVPRGKLFPEFTPHGLMPFGSSEEHRRFEDLVRDEGFFCERDYAERTPDLKQIIPYTVFRVDGEVLLMRRLAAGGEGRLHDKLSIGVGGHINPEDLSSTGSSDPIRAGTTREIEEEIEVRGSYELRPVGFLNDDSSPVGAVHVGMVQIADVQGTVQIREKEVLEGRLATPAELRRRVRDGENFETWSSLLVEHTPSLLDAPVDDPIPSQPDPVSAKRTLSQVPHRP